MVETNQRLRLCRMIKHHSTQHSLSGPSAIIFEASVLASCTPQKSHDRPTLPPSILHNLPDSQTHSTNSAISQKAPTTDSCARAKDAQGTKRRLIDWAERGCTVDGYSGRRWGLNIGVDFLERILRLHLLRSAAPIAPPRESWSHAAQTPPYQQHWMLFKH